MGPIGISFMVWRPRLSELTFQVVGIRTALLGYLGSAGGRGGRRAGLGPWRSAPTTET